MKNALATLLVIAVLLAVYSGTYLAAVQPEQVVVVAVHCYGQFKVEDYYRFGGDLARWVFWPANQVDRRLRRSTWAETETETGVP